jgi:hypothetical protein
MRSWVKNFYDRPTSAICSVRSLQMVVELAKRQGIKIPKYKRQ